MKSKSLQLNTITWLVSPLGEQALLLEPQLDEIEISVIHQATQVLETAEISELVDLIPSYKSIALVYGRVLGDLDEEVSTLKRGTSGIKIANASNQLHEVPVCYDLGLDWEEVESYTGFSKSEIISRHSKKKYTVALMGFIPGFIYLSGMDRSITCPRKENPRTQIPRGAVGIGGNQTGIYSLESPGGWQIIGRTPHSCFDIDSDPPTNLRAGDTIQFVEISKKEFQDYKA